MQVETRWIKPSESCPRRDLADCIHLVFLTCQMMMVATADSGVCYCVSLAHMTSTEGRNCSLCVDFNIQSFLQGAYVNEFIVFVCVLVVDA